MPPVLGYPYAHFRLSEALSTTEQTALLATGVDLSAAALAGENVTVAGQTIATHQLGPDVRSFNDSMTWAEIDQTSVVDESKRIVRGRSTFTLEAKMFVNYDTDMSYDTIVKDSDGYRLLYIERQAGRHLVAVVQMSQVNETTGDEGNLEIDVTFKNSGAEPKWA